MIIEEVDFKVFRKAVGFEFMKLRHKRSVTIRNTSLCCKIKPRDIDRMELGKKYRPQTYSELLSYYGKRIKIELVD